MFLLLISLFIITFIVLKTDQDITISLMKSYIQENKYNRSWTAFILAFIFPITLTHYLILKLKNKMNLKKIITIFISIVILILTTNGIIYISKEIIGFSNTEIELTSQFKAQKQQRISFYDKMYKQISQNSQIAVHNDSSFYHIVNVIMTNQPTNLNLMLGAIKLIDPSANYDKVSKFYDNLVVIVNSNREGFFQQEVTLQTINRDHENLLRKFPGNFYNMYFKRDGFIYKPILSTQSNNVDITGIDNNLKLF